MNCSTDAVRYKLVGFAAFIAGPTDGEVILVSTYGGVGGGDCTELAGVEECCYSFGVGFRLRGPGDSEVQQLYCSVVGEEAVAGF